jgi:hypothetical protein
VNRPVTKEQRIRRGLANARTRAAQKTDPAEALLTWQRFGASILRILAE